MPRRVPRPFKAGREWHEQTRLRAASRARRRAPEWRRALQRPLIPPRRSASPRGRARRSTNTPSSRATSGRLFKNGEYVYYVLDGDAAADGREPRRVLGRILQRVPVQLFPDTFLAEPERLARAGRRAGGLRPARSDLFELQRRHHGLLRRRLGAFVNPWIPPSSGTPIYLADDALLAAVLSRKRSGAVGSALIGSLLTRPEGAVPVVLDVKEYGQHAPGDHRQHRRGQELPRQRRHRGADAARTTAPRCSIVDPHGEYSHAARDGQPRRVRRGRAAARMVAPSRAPSALRRTRDARLPARSGEGAARAR